MLKGCQALRVTCSVDRGNGHDKVLNGSTRSCNKAARNVADLAATIGQQSAHFRNVTPPSVHSHALVQVLVCGP